MLVIAEVFAVYGTEYIFSDLGALKAVGAAWLLLAIVDVSEPVGLYSCQLLWILFLTSEEGTPFHTLLNIGGNGGLSSSNRRAIRRDSTAGFANHGDAGVFGGNMNGASYAEGGGINAGTGYVPSARSGGHSMGGNNGITGYAPAATETTPQRAVIREEPNNFNSPVTDDPYKLRAK